MGVRADLNRAKAILAFETTALAYGHQATIKAHLAAAAAFEALKITHKMQPTRRILREKMADASATLPTTRIKKREITGTFQAINNFCAWD